MFTVRMRIACPGTLALNRRVIPSSGWMRTTSRLGSIAPATGAPAGDASWPPKGEWGTRRNWMATSVARRGRRLPVRR